MFRAECECLSVCKSLMLIVCCLYKCIPLIAAVAADNAPPLPAVFGSASVKLN